MEKKLKLFFKISLTFFIFFIFVIEKSLSDEIFDAGKKIFLEQGNCVTCHTLSDVGSQANIGPNLDEISPDLSRVKIAVTLGIGVMPAYDGILTSDEIHSVSYYVSESIKK